MSSPGPSRKPEDSPFKQQRLKAWQPILTPNWVIGTFAIVGILFVPIGIVLKNKSDDVMEVEIQYDGSGTHPEYSCAIEEEDAGTDCTIKFTPEEDFDDTVYVYYQLENFYQNHRRYVKSRSDSQLRGDEVSDSDLDECDPLKRNGDLILQPCGLIANTLFNDVFTVSSEDGEVEMIETGISWKSDREDKFRNPAGYPENVDTEKYQYLYETYPMVVDQAEGVKNEHFIVWMRTAGLPDFRKLYGKIEGGLKKGVEVTVNIEANFEVASFDGKKSIVFSTTSFFGGKNPFLGVAYITVGSLCLFLAGLFMIKHMVSPRPLGDTRYLVWKNRQ